MGEIGICGGTGTVLCRFSTGKDNLAVSRVGKKLHTLVNNRAVMASKPDELMDRAAPVISMLIVRMCEDNKVKQIRLASPPSEKDTVSNLLKFVRNNMKPAEVSVLEAQPDEQQENSPSEINASNIPYDAYHKHMNEVSMNIDDLRHKSGILLRTNLAKEMWGSKEVTAVFNDIRGRFAKSEETASHIEDRMEKIGSDVRIMKTGMSDPRMNVREAASRMLDNFSIVKGYMSDAAQSLYPLYDIDRTFKASTGYPATWFLMSSILMDFKYGYESLLGNMVRNAKFETTAMEPILVWKIRTTGVPQNVR